MNVCILCIYFHCNILCNFVQKKLFHVTKANSQSGRSEQTLPKKLYLWQLSGPIKRRGRRQKYTFFQEIVRGKEKIQVSG